MRTFIVHGYSASVDAHWFPWLAERLENAGHRVSIVDLPTPTAPIRREWDARLAAERVTHGRAVQDSRRGPTSKRLGSGPMRTRA
ncbi:alpha/beta hydrolase [Nocardia sp. NPDC051570]|uniref:alpha/beta hydrolase n=1 Tax=Nocardia sp. NPDC051570 TaxID=3364324 RepID=UPI0037A80DD9